MKRSARCVTLGIKNRVAEEHFEGRAELLEFILEPLQHIEDWDGKSTQCLLATLMALIRFDAACSPRVASHNPLTLWTKQHGEIKVTVNCANCVEIAESVYFSHGIRPSTESEFAAVETDSTEEGD
jgi:hypothetical protein